MRNCEKLTYLVIATAFATYAHDYTRTQRQLRETENNQGIGAAVLAGHNIEHTTNPLISDRFAGARNYLDDESRRYKKW